MWVYVGNMFIHAKFNDPDGHRTADMAETLKFGIFWVFLSISYGKTVIRIEAGIQNSA